MKTETDVVIIGGGPAGITFARKLKQLKPETRITMLRPEPHSMVYCAIPYAIEGLFKPEKVFKQDELVTDVGINLIQRKAVKVDLKRKKVVDDAGDEYSAGFIFLATGASPVIPPIPGSHARNIYTVKTQKDMEALIKGVKKAKKAVVIGAGAIGIEQAQAYKSLGLETYLLEMAPRVLPSMVDEEMAVAIHNVIRKNGVNLMLSTRVTEIDTNGINAKRIKTSGGESIELNPDNDFVCFSTGMKPDVELFTGQGLDIDNDGIIVDNRMRTNLAGIFAAGDCCSYVSLIDGKPLGGKLATNAVPMAKTCARVIAGESDEYPGFVNGAATCAWDLRIGSTGFTEELAKQRGFETVTGTGETTTLFPMMPGADNLKVKIVADARDLKIIGAQVISGLSATDKIDVISLAIQNRLTLKQLSKLSYSAQPWQSFFPARNAIVEASENALDSFNNTAGSRAE